MSGTAKNRKKNKRWVLPRHKILLKIVNFFYGKHVIRKYNIDITPFTERGDRNYLVLFNHQTAADQFFVGLAFEANPVYYVASEDLFSNGTVSKIIKFIVNPIPIKKQTTDPRAVINCIKVAKEGGTIALAPEGNRTYDGRPVYIKPSIAQLAMHLKLPIAFFKIEGGFGMHPRWSDVVRKGKMKAGVRRVMEHEEYKDMTAEQLSEIINSELYVDEAKADAEYHSKALAEYVERFIYVCPDCGLSSFESHGDTIECKKCGLKAKYLPTKELCGVGKEFPYRFLADWYNYQCSYVNGLKLTDMVDKPVYCDTARFSRVILYKNKRCIHKAAKISLFGDKITVEGKGDTLTLSFDDLSTVTVLGKNKLALYHNGDVFQVKGDKRFNALKYVNFYYRYKNITKGQEDSDFLGL